jgi:hypothetical protein
MLLSHLYLHIACTKVTDRQTKPGNPHKINAVSEVRERYQLWIEKSFRLVFRALIKKQVPDKH